MSVVGEVVGVIACIAGIVSAYKDGSVVIKRIKDKRAQKKAPPPPRLLEDSIDQAPQEIEREKQRGVARFGRAFEEGDHIAVIALQQITIQLQASLLEKLRHAAFEDEHQIIDFTYLVDAADLGRDRTIATMLQFRQRLLDAKPIVEMSIPAPNLLQSISEMEPSQSSVEKADPQPVLPQSAPPRHYPPWKRDFGSSPGLYAHEDKDTAPGADDTALGIRKRSTFLHFLKHPRGHSVSDPKSPPLVTPPLENTPRHVSTASASLPHRPLQRSGTADTASDHQGSQRLQLQPKAVQPPNSTQQTPPRPNYIYQPWEDDPAVIWARPGLDRRETVSVAPDAVQPPSTQSLLPATIQRTNSGSSTVQTPTPENEYLGFCKGAWKLQNGDRKGALSKQREVEAWSRHPSGNTTSFLACTHHRCAFRSHVNFDIIWDKAFTVQSKGLKFRWAFLAKSHVTQRVVVRNQYTFQCLFCTLLGEKGRLYHGIDPYLDHVASEHRGQRLNELILYKTNCISDRISAEDDNFDINLWPLSPEEVHERGKPDPLCDESLDDGARRNTDAADSMFSEENWNEGLSNFHYPDEHERIGSV